jgi:hypothetical protein
MTATTNSGASFGANPTNQALGSNLARSSSGSRSKASLLMVWAVPVVPPTENPGTLAPRPVPLSFTDLHIPSRTASRFSAENRGAETCKSTGTCQSPPRVRCICGVLPVATIPTARANCMGVTLTAPWPIDTEIVSPSYQGWPNTSLFHSREGMVPATSPGRSIPVLLPNPTMCPYLAMASMPIFRPIK